MPRKKKDEAAAPLEALAASEPKGKKVSAGQRKSLDRIMGQIRVLAGEYETDIAEAEKPEYQDELPPSVVPKSKIEMAGLKLMLAELEMAMGEGWTGDAKEAIQKATACLKAAIAHYAKFNKRLRQAAAGIDSQHIKREE